MKEKCYSILYCLFILHRPFRYVNSWCVYITSPKLHLFLFFFFVTLLFPCQFKSRWTAGKKKYTEKLFNRWCEIRELSRRVREKKNVVLQSFVAESQDTSIGYSNNMSPTPNCLSTRESLIHKHKKLHSLSLLVYT